MRPARERAAPAAREGGDRFRVERRGGTMSCALVPFGSFQDLEAARDFLCPHRRQGSAAAGRESGESDSLLEGELGFGPACGAR